jgi:hypothetical protein
MRYSPKQNFGYLGMIQTSPSDCHSPASSEASCPRTGDLDQLIFKGNLFIQEVFFFHKRSRTFIAADFIQNHPIERGKPLLNALWKLGGVAYLPGGVPLDIRLSFTDRTLARRSLEKLLLWDFDKLIIAHGVCIEKEAKRFMKQAFRWLAH